jgi:hypothetical protein
MAPRLHCSPEQKEYLESFKTKYLALQEKNRLHDFWPAVYGGWFTAWPEDGSEEAEATAKQKQVSTLSLIISINMS